MNVADVVVIGAGIAGLTTAAMLKARRLKVLVVEREISWARRASGNRAGIISPYLRSPASSALHDKNADFFAPAFDYALEFFAQFPPGVFSQCGVVQLPSTKRLSRMVTEVREGALRHEDVVALSRAEISEVSGAAIDAEGLYHPRGGWIDPRALCDSLVREQLGGDAITGGIEIVSVTPVKDGWTLRSRSEELFACGVVVFANAFECRSLSLTEHLPLEPVRGTIATGFEPVTLAGLKCVVCHNGYVIPCGGNERVFGTTYRHGVTGYDEDAGEVEELKSSLLRWLPRAEPRFSEVRICYRTSTRDRMPIVGPLVDIHGATVPRAFLSVGHGSRGFVSAPYAAKLLAAQICG
jgi:tRNA 5-methylaminomethyl-2-thiouridine biosynthesis bifunctional protein